MTSETNNTPHDSQSFWRRLRHTPVRDLLWRRQITGRMDVEAILTSFALPASCADVVRRVVKKSRLWRLEKAELTSELAAHFHDGLQEGRSETDLIKDFGDPGKAAKLIRRAKVRCRPMFWHVARGVMRAVAVFVLLYFVLVGYYALGKPEIKVNYLRQLNAAAEKVAPEDRAWPLYREAAIQLKLAENRNNKDWPLNKYLDAMGEGKPVPPEMRQWMRDNESVLDLIRRGASKPALGYIHRLDATAENLQITYFNIPASSVNEESDPYTANLPLTKIQFSYVEPISVFARMMHADTELSLEAGDLNRVSSNLQAIDGLAKHSFDPAFALPALSGQSIRARHLYLLGAIVAQDTMQLPEDFLLQESHRLARWSIREQAQQSLAGERLFFEDMMQRIYTDNGSGGGRWTPAGFHDFMTTYFMTTYFMTTYGSPAFKTDPADSKAALSRSAMIFMCAPLAGMVIADRQEMMSRFEAIMQHYQTLLSLKKRDVQAYEAQHPSPWKTIEQDKIRYLMIFSMAPALDAWGWRCERSEVLRDGVLLGIALTLYHRKEGRYPETLAELSPKYMAEIPVDPMNGEPLKYRVTENGPLVYGVGTNHKDDGGKPTQDAWRAQRWLSNAAEREQPQYQGDWILWPMPRE
jgi:hypothetical protein